MRFILLCLWPLGSKPRKAGNKVKRIYKRKIGIKLFQISYLFCNDITQRLNDLVHYGKSEMKEWVWSFFLEGTYCFECLFSLLTTGWRGGKNIMRPISLLKQQGGQKQGKHRGTQDSLSWRNRSCGAAAGPAVGGAQDGAPGSIAAQTHSQVSFRAGVSWWQQEFCHGKNIAN